MKNSRLEKDKQIEPDMSKDVKNHFRLKKGIDDTTVN